MKLSVWKGFKLHQGRLKTLRSIFKYIQDNLYGESGSVNPEKRARIKRIIDATK